MKAKCVYENLEFERGKDPKKTMQIGKYKDFYGKTADQIASKIVSDLEYFLDPYFGQLSDLAEEKGYESIEDYQESIWDEKEYEPLTEKKDSEIEAFINEIFKKAEDFIKEKYPIKKPYRDSRYLEPAASIASTIIGAYIDGAPHGTMLSEISKEIDMSLLESYNFERGQDPKKAIGIGMEERIRKSMKEYYPGDYEWNGDYNEALIFAAETGQTDMIKWLLNAGADVEYDDNGAFKAAIIHGRDEAVEVLVDAGADPLAGNRYAILAAKFGGHKELSDRIKELAGGRDEYGNEWKPKTVRENLEFERGQIILCREK